MNPAAWVWPLKVSKVLIFLPTLLHKGVNICPNFLRMESDEMVPSSEVHLGICQLQGEPGIYLNYSLDTGPCLFDPSPWYEVLFGCQRENFPG